MFLWILCFLPFGWATASDGQWFPELETAMALEATTNTSAVFSDKFLSSRSLEAIAKDPDTDGHTSGAVSRAMVGASVILWVCLAASVYYCGCSENCSRKSQAQGSKQTQTSRDPGLQASREPRPPSSPRGTSSPELPKLLGAASKAPSVPAPVASPASKPASAPAPAAAPKVVLSCQISAQWPRGKVASFTLQATGSFQAFGHQYTLDPQDLNLVKGQSKFRWPDGTVQTLDRKDKNTFWWRTNHPNPEWQHFQWVCTPCCTCGPHGNHTMAFSESSYKCSVCNSSRGHEEHWQCVAHDVHVCCNCTVPPLKTPTLGVSARYIVDFFPSLARNATGLESPNFHEIRPELATGERGLGFRKTCPRDGRPNCSIVDALEDEFSGKVTHFVSWCWGYKLQDFVSAISLWLQRSELNAEDVFLWVCFFCNNQYRIMQEGTQTGSDELKSVFETHLADAGQMLVLLDKFLSPLYIQRAWCIFECFVCIKQEFSMTVILAESAEADFKDALNSTFLQEVRESVRKLDVRDAKASSTADEDAIKRLILTSPGVGFDTLNHAVRKRLVERLIGIVTDLLSS